MPLFLRRGNSEFFGGCPAENCPPPLFPQQEADVKTPGLLTWVPGDGSSVATDTRGQEAVPLGWPGLWVGGTGSPRSLCSLGILGAMFLEGKGPPEIRLLPV